jgi:hypothetical protein
MQERLQLKKHEAALTDSEILLANAKIAATMCGKSVRTWRSWDAQGLIPRPARIRHSTLWSIAELRAWVAAGCPCRETWEAGK